VIARMSKQYAVQPDTLEAQHADWGLGYGEIAMVYGFARSSKTKATPDQVVDMRRSGMSWENIGKKLGVKVDNVASRMKKTGVPKPTPHKIGMASRRKPAARSAKTRPAPKRPLAERLPEASPALEACACVTDLEAIARQKLPKGVYDYYAGGAEDEQTVHANRDAYRHVYLRPRALVGVARVDTATAVLGIPISLPVLLAPVAYQRMADPEGEVATARAAAAAGTLMVVSTIATASIEEVASAAPAAPRWFQLYMAPEREISEHLIARAEAAGYRALCLTVDTPLLGRRERDVRNRFNPGMALANFEGDIAWMPRTQSGSSFAVGASRLLDPSLTWETIRWMRGRTKLPIIVKGVIAASDVEPAIEAGVSGIVVSNHGGRQLDGC